MKVVNSLKFFVNVLKFWLIRQALLIESVRVFSIGACASSKQLALDVIRKKQIVSKNKLNFFIIIY